MELLQVGYVPANQLIGKLVEMGLLEEVTGNQRNRVYLFGRYLDVFRDEDKTA